MNQRDDVPMVQMGIRLPQNILEWARKLAIECKRKPSEVIRLALEHAKENGWRP